MFLFAITTPVGILIGLLSFAQSGDQGAFIFAIFNSDTATDLQTSNSTNEADARPNVRNIGWTADIRSLRRDARWRFRDGLDAVAKSGVEADGCNLEFITWCYSNGRNWVRLTLSGAIELLLTMNCCLSGISSDRQNVSIQLF